MLLGHEATRLQLEVDGTIQAARDDRCLRIGLNPIGAPLAAAHRWFPSSKGLRSCQVPDDWLLHNRRALLFGRDVLKAVMAAFTPGSQAA